MSALTLHLLSGWIAACSAGADPLAEAAWQARIEVLICDLGDASFAKRDAATRTLMAEDPKIVPLLDKARPGAGLELQRRIDRIRYQLIGTARGRARLESWGRNRASRNAGRSAGRRGARYS